MSHLRKGVSANSFDCIEESFCYNEGAKLCECSSTRMILLSVPQRLLLAIGLIFVIAFPSAAQNQAQSGPIEMTVTALYGGNYARGKWLPLSIVLRNDGPATDVLIAAAIPNSSLRSTLTVTLAGAVEQQVMLYAAMDEQSRELRVSLEQGATVLDEQRLEVRPRSGERMMALVAERPLQLQLPLRQDLFELPFLPLNQSLNALPDQLAGLSSLALIFVNDSDSTAFRPAQLDALLAWVHSGGHLVLGGGPGAERSLAGLPPHLTVATLGPERALDTTFLGSYAAAPPPAQLSGLTLQPLTGTLTFGPNDAPLWAQRDLGYGRVTQLAFDPTALGTWPGGPQLWDTLLMPPLIIRLPNGVEFSPDYAREQLATTAVLNLPTVNLPNSTPLFLLLAVYTLLIGPGIALVLRRYDRQALGWIVLPAVGLLTTLIAMGIALSLRADERVVSSVTLLEQVGDGVARARTFAGIVSPREELVSISAPATALVRPLRELSGSFGSVTGVSGDLAQQQEQFAVPLVPWQLQGVLGDGLVEFDALDVQLTFGQAAIQAVVLNTTGRNLRDVVILYGEQLVELGDLGPGEQVVKTWPPAPGPGEGFPIGTAASAIVLANEREANLGVGGRLTREFLARQQLIDAAVSRGNLDPSEGPFVFAFLDTTPLPIDFMADGAARNGTTLLIGQPRIRGAGAVTIPPGWLRPSQSADDRPRSCSAGAGRGIDASRPPFTATLSLPPAMAAFQANEIVLRLESSQPWPNAGIVTEIYNWDAQRWDTLDYDGPGDLPLLNGAPYMRAGRVQLRLDGRIREADCLYISGRMTGVLP
jgi:hypothetical protein